MRINKLLIIVIVSLLLMPETVFAELNHKYLLHVNKQMHSLNIIDLDNGQIIRKFNISTGKNIGNKIRRGDRKTPEGKYKIVSVERSYGRMGPYKFRLNYPNTQDRRSGKTGDGILIHGTRYRIGANTTDGCITMRPGDILELKKFIAAGSEIYISSGAMTANDTAGIKTAYSKNNSWSLKNRSVFGRIIKVTGSAKRFQIGTPFYFKVSVINDGRKGNGEIIFRFNSGERLLGFKKSNKYSGFVNTKTGVIPSVHISLNNWRKGETREIELLCIAQSESPIEFEAVFERGKNKKFIIKKENNS